MIETLEEQIDRFYEHFARQAASVGSLSETPESDLFARILLTSMLDTFSKVSANDTDDQILPGERFAIFITSHSGWSAATRVSLLHLARALEGQSGSSFSGLCSWVAERLSTALPAIPNPEFVAQHPGLVERPITVDPMLEETEKHWPKENGKPIMLKTRYIRARRGLPPSNPSDPVWKVTTRRWELVYTLGFLRQLCETSLQNLRQQLRSESRNPYQAFKFGSYWLSVLN